MITQKPATNVKRGDLVVFQTPALAAVRCGVGGTFIKRVIALPGERFEERSGYVFINGTKLDEPYIEASRRDARTIAPTTVPSQAYIVLGDNRSSSCDSRQWGPLPARDLIGKVVRIIRLK